MPRDLIAKLPKYYRTSGVMAQLLGTDEATPDAVDSLLENVGEQCLIATADELISRWETIYGIPNSDLDIERRRERLLARKRGGGNGTVEHLKQVISAFSNGEVEITELYGQYMITISFVGLIGVPPYLDDVKAAIDEIIPAHIGYTIVIVYRTWADIAGYTWADIADKTWHDVAEGEI